MLKRNLITRDGFTLIEMIVATAMTVIVILGVAIVLVNSQRAYQVTYDKVYSDVMTDAFVARRLFDSIVRKSSTDGIALSSDRKSVEVHYYNNDSSTYLDRYARFYTSGLNLRVEYGLVNSSGTKQTLNTDTICTNVTSCVFMNQGNSVRMVLKFDDEQKENVVVTSAYLHN
jgi:hypothetical protein